MRMMNPSDATPQSLRRFLLATWLFGTLGTGMDLWLMGHVEGFWQRLPLLLLGASFVAVLCWFLTRRRSVVRGFQFLMVLFLVSGPLGMVQHFRAKSEFQREMDPTLRGWELFRQCMTGHTLPPVLAPGGMALLGLLGLAWAGAVPVSSIRESQIPTSNR